LKWKEAYIASLYKIKTKTNAAEQVEEEEGEFVYPTFKGFIDTFQGYFQPINQARTANHQLATIKQGKRTVEEFIADFQLLISTAGMTVTTDSDNIHLINYFQQGLNPAIAKKIALSNNVPTTVNGWAEKAMQIRYELPTHYGHVWKTSLQQGLFGALGKRKFQPPERSIRDGYRRNDHRRMNNTDETGKMFLV
jgi:hypothetical protein